MSAPHGFPGSEFLFGLAGAGLLSYFAKLLKRALRAPEDYYGDEG